MFSSELRNLLFQVITSWQVIVVTVVLILYLFLVFYVARGHHKKRPANYASTGKKAAEAKTPPAETAEGDELGLEEPG